MKKKGIFSPSIQILESSLYSRAQYLMYLEAKQQGY